MTLFDLPSPSVPFQFWHPQALARVVESRPPREPPKAPVTERPILMAVRIFPLPTGGYWRADSTEDRLGNHRDSSDGSGIPSATHATSRNPMAALRCLQVNEATVNIPEELPQRNYVRLVFR